MRASEVLGLKGGFVYDDHIYLCKQYDEYGYRDTKTKDKHNIPLPSDLINDLKELKRMNGEGFVFSLDGGATPVCRKTMYQDYHRALRNIGLSEDEISERHLHLHAWRHFFNTELLKGGLSIPQAQAITGHKSDRMTEWYCHFDPNEFAQARGYRKTCYSRKIQHRVEPLREQSTPQRKPPKRKERNRERRAARPGGYCPFHRMRTTSKNGHSSIPF
jgi:hypothetical protein